MATGERSDDGIDRLAEAEMTDVERAHEHVASGALLFAEDVICVGSTPREVFRRTLELGFRLDEDDWSAVLMWLRSQGGSDGS